MLLTEIMALKNTENYVNIMSVKFKSHFNVEVTTLWIRGYIRSLKHLCLYAIGVL